MAAEAEESKKDKKEQKKKERKEAKNVGASSRRRVLTRTPTNEKQVPLTRYALHPSVTRGILKTLKAGNNRNHNPEFLVPSLQDFNFRARFSWTSKEEIPQ